MECDGCRVLAKVETDLLTKQEAEVLQFHHNGHIASIAVSTLERMR